MVNGYELATNGEAATNGGEMTTRTELVETTTIAQGTAIMPPATKPKTTTIGTIALQSGGTRLVIALLESGEYLRLKVLEMQPELTKLGVSPDEAKELLHAHDEVLLRLQDKQSPVEELLRQADQVISSQKPKAEVYKAMAETLAAAWKDVNELLERRKDILERNVLFQCQAEDCRESMRALENACNDTHLPIDIDSVKHLVKKLHELRKTMLEMLMGALKDGKILLDRLRDISNEGSLDSRPDRLKADADSAIHKVENWLEELHDKRRHIEILFQKRKTQLEQCLGLALLATDLRELEDTLNDRVNALSNSSDHLGDSSASAELLLYELRKLQVEAKEIQDKALKITKSTEHLASSGHFAGAQATQQAYAILGTAADYINDLDQYELLLNRALAFFESARSVFTKLDQLEIQLATTEHPPRSSSLSRLHAQSCKTLEDITAAPLAEGYALLDVTGRGAPGAEGVRRTVEEMEDRKIRLLERCTAHREENVRISRCLSDFIEKYEELSNWLSGIVEAFLRGHQDMGSDLTMARDFYRLHVQLLEDLDKRADEVRKMDRDTIPDEVLDHLQATERADVFDKVEALRSSWSMSRTALEARLKLASMYVEFHQMAANVDGELDQFEAELKKHADDMNDEQMKELERRWSNLQPKYAELTNTGKKFLDESSKIVDSYLDVPRACLCVKSVLEKFSNKQYTITQQYENTVTTITIKKELRIEQEKRIKESAKTIETVSKFREQLYPVITCQSSKPDDVLKNLDNSKQKILPELSHAVTELDARIKNIESLGLQVDEFNTAVKKQLYEVSERLRSTSSDYKSLLDDLSSVFEKLSQVEHEIESERKSVESSSTLNRESLHEVRALLERLDGVGRSLADNFKRAKQESERVIVKIQSLEPDDAARQDIDKVNQAFRLTVDKWNNYSTTTRARLQERLDFCLFGDDLDKINAELKDLAEQLSTISGWLGESLSSAKGASEAFVQFEKTLNILELRIEEFIRNTEISVGKNLPKIQNELTGLRNKLKTLKGLTDETRKRIDLSIDYFDLLDQAKEWFKEGSKLLIVVARKATSVKTPEDASVLLREIDAFLKPGEEKQEKRIEKIRELSTKIFGTDRLPQFQEVVTENREMLDSFAVISSELRTLSENLRNAEDLRENLKREREEADVQLRKAQAAAAEAENARLIAERLTAETLERAAEEARKLAEKEVTSAAAQTDSVCEVDAVPKKSVMEATFKKEVHIVEKTEIDEQHHHISTVKKEEELIVEPVDTKVEEKQVQSESTQTIDLPTKPEFTLPLYDATIQEGEKFMFECRVTGQPRPEISWHKDSLPIANNPDYVTSYDEDGRCTLTIEETFAEDSAKFCCKATNEAGSAETEAFLKVRETSPDEQLTPPLFIKELSPSFASEGSAYELECKVQGNPLPTVSWFKNEENIDNSPDYVTTYNNGEAILKFEEVYLDDQAEYTCRAANRIGNAATSTVLIVEAFKPREDEAFIIELPTITKPPSNVTVKAGESVKLECEASGTPPFTFTWTHDGKTLENVETVTIRSDEAYGRSIIELIEPRAGDYVVTAINAAGEAQAGCHVAVKVKEPSPPPPPIKVVQEQLPVKSMEPKAPRVQLPLKDITVAEGASARLDCIIVGQPEPEVIWYHADRPVKESADFQLLFQGDRCSLVIHEAFLDDAGVYKVVAINSGGEASSECSLTVTPRSVGAAESSPKFTKLLTDLLIAEGEEAKFECEVTGEPKPTVIWYLNSEPILESDRIKILLDERGRSVLRIFPTLPDDKGNYTAKATNRVGEAKAFAKLVVKVLGVKDDAIVQMEEKLVAPHFKEKFQSRVVPEGVATKFECIVVGKPAPKIQWFFNDEPVRGKDFLVSVSGDRQVLTIPEVANVHVGNISCVAENAAGKAICEAKIEVGGGVKAEEGLIEVVPSSNESTMQASSSSDKYFVSERTTGGGEGPHGDSNQSTTTTKTSSSIVESSTMHTTMKKEYVTSTSSSTLSSCPAAHQPPTSVCLKKSSQSHEHSSAYNGAPPVVQSQKIEEFEQIVQESPDEIRQEKTVIVTQDTGGTRQKERMHQVQVQKPCRKQTAPRFVSPVTGMIVDQGADIVLEGIVDGFPLPEITWTKNGQEVQSYNGIKISYDHNHVKLEIKDVKVKDAGRYTCTARNDVGSSSSTADLVVKKTIFPPVFGRRLQAQVVKKGDRVIMEVEITGTPTPEVTWYKDDEPIIEPEFATRKNGNSYYLYIDKAEKEHAGKFMVRASNAGGEAQSIADFAVFEPTPDTMVEMHKTLVYENVQDKNARKPCCGQPTEIPGANLTTEQITTTMIQPSAAIKTPFPSTSASSTIRTIKSETSEEIQKASRTEMISSSIESHKSETKSEQKFHMKLEHKPAPFDASSREERTETTQTTVGGQDVVDQTTEVTENENIETSTMAKKDALNFFESMSKGSDSILRGPKDMIKLTDEDDGTGPGCDVRVNQLTKNYERTTKFEEAAREVPKPDIAAGKKAVQEIFNKFEKSSTSSRGVDNTLFDFPYEEHKLPPLSCTRTILEDVTASGSPIHGTLTISKLAAQSESAEAMLKGFNLVPEPPPEIGYAPKPDEGMKYRPDVSFKAKQLQESFEKTKSPIDAPIGGVKIFPTAPPKTVAPKSQEKSPTRPLSIPPPFELSQNETLDQRNVSSTYSDKKEWTLPDRDYKVSSSSAKQEIDLKPEFRMTQTTIESSSSLEKKSFGSKEINVTENKYEPPPSPPKPKPIIYNAETIKVGHTINTIEEKSVTEKYTAECDVHKSETTEKKFESSRKQTARPWPDSKDTDLKAPRLVKNATEFTKPVVKMYHPAPAPSPAPAPCLKPGSPPEMGYAPCPFVQEKKVEKIETICQRSTDQKPSYVPPCQPPKPAPTPILTKKTEEYITKDYKVGAPSQSPSTTTKYSRSSFYSESDYESELDNTRTTGYRHVQAPVTKPCYRAKSTEPEPLPPSSFEVPSTNLTGPPRPVVTPDLTEKKSSVHYEKDSRSYQSQQYGSLPKPGSPPVYVQPTKPVAAKPAFKPDSPKFKTKTFQKESGYMADTDEPLHMQQRKQFSESCSSFSETRSSFMESKSFSSSGQQKKDSSFSQSQSYSSTPKTEMQRSSFVEKIVEKSPTPRFRPAPAAKETSHVSQTQSRFSKGEFRESDYESDLDSSRISSTWKPQASAPSSSFLSSAQSSAQTMSEAKSSSSSTVKSIQSSFSSTGSPWSGAANGERIIPIASEVVKPYIEILPKKAPLFITPLRDIAVVSGQTARFECIVQAEPQPNIVWSKDGRVIENSINADVYYRNGVCRLTLPRTTPDDAGSYTCTATNSLGSNATNASLQVPVSDAMEPVIEYEHKNKCYPDKTSRFVALKDLFLSPEIHIKSSSLLQTSDSKKIEPWKFSNESLHYESGNIDQVSRRLDFSDTETSMESSDDSNSLHILKYVPQNFVDNDENISISPTSNGYKHLPAPEKCRIEYLPPTQKNKQYAYEPTVTDSTESFKIVAFENQLLRDKKYREAITKYNVRKLNSQIDTINESLQPLEPPKIMQKHKCSRFSEGSDGIFYAKISGNPRPVVTWLKNGRRLISSQYIEITDKNHESKLKIADITPEDAGYYTLVLENPYGVTLSSAYLTVESTDQTDYVPAQFDEHFVKTSQSKNLPIPESTKVQTPKFIHTSADSCSIIEGDKARFNCQIIAHPSPEISWYINDIPVTNDDTHQILVNEKDSTSLLISAVSTSDQGLVKCVAHNVTGVSSCYFNLNVINKENDSAPKPVEPEIDQENESNLVEEVSISKPLNSQQKDEVKFITSPKRFTANNGFSNLHIDEITVGDTGLCESTSQNTANSTVPKDRSQPSDEIILDSSQNISHPAEIAEPTSVTVPKSISLPHNDTKKPENYIFIPTKVFEHNPKNHQQIPELEITNGHQIKSSDKTTSQRPIFTRILKDSGELREGRSAHFEAQLMPISDRTMRVMWYKNEQPITADSRISTIFNFGYVSLNIMNLRGDDAGFYTVRAVNHLGEASSSAFLRVLANENYLKDLKGRRHIHTEVDQLSIVDKNTSLHMNQPDTVLNSSITANLRKVKNTDFSENSTSEVEDYEQIDEIPSFVGKLKGTNEIAERQRAHFEICVQPQNDRNMKIEWLHNGKPIATANRIQMYQAFGYVAIDIHQVRSEDAGTYTVIARNNVGEVQMSTELIVKSRFSPDTKSLHPGSYEKTRNIENMKLTKPQQQFDETVPSKLVFAQPSSFARSSPDTKSSYPDTPHIKDTTLVKPQYQLEKTVQSKPIFSQPLDFRKERQVDEVNEHSTATPHSFNNLSVPDNAKYNKPSAIDTLETKDSSRHQKVQSGEVTIKQVPQFTRPLRNIETVELSNVHLECRLQPVGDTSMKVDWLINGRPIRTGHRFRPSHDFNYVGLDILGVYAEDSGVYTCLARNRLGEAATSCTVKVQDGLDLILDSQHPQSLEHIQYLENVTRHKRPDVVDEFVNVKPKFTSCLKTQENLNEGQNAHFECKLEPVTDSNLKVEWSKDNQPITIGHRFRPVHDFGYAALDIINLIAEDSGTYTCRAVNMVGEDVVTFTLRCNPSTHILSDTHNESGLEKIISLEDKYKYHSVESIDETTAQAPVFTTSLNDVQIIEGQKAHLECRLIPVSDATMNVEWYHDNVPVKTGSRYVQTNNFGFITFDIVCAYPEDTGLYTCQAKNANGEAITSATVIVDSKKSVDDETQNEKALQKIRQLENVPRRPRTAAKPDIVTQAPVFTVPIKDAHLNENEGVLFEARMIPVGDSKMKLEWLRNGVPIPASNRITAIHDFGYVALRMKYVNPEDAGTYTCRAINNLGEAVTAATLFVQPRAALQTESSHEETLSKLQDLEARKIHEKYEKDESPMIIDEPKFTVPLNGPANLNEGENVHYECRIEPYPDDSLEVEWFHNGERLSLGHRYRTSNNFGFASLDILSVRAEDSGDYTCTAVNQLGRAESTVNLHVQPRLSVLTDTKHEGALKKIQQLESDHETPMEDTKTMVIQKPKFGRPLKNIEHLPEGENAHIEATLSPVNDETMSIEWYKDGKLIPMGHKFKTTCDFGYVALDILYAFPEDSGTYMCKAKNTAGEAVTTCVIIVDAKENIYNNPIDAGRLKKIQLLENAKPSPFVEKEEVHQKPAFVSPLNNLELQEGERAHLECRIEPINDTDLHIDWFVNGKPVKIGHRFRKTHDFGYVALDILYTYAEDSGNYMCKATNPAGEAVNTCTIKVGSRQSLILESLHPNGLEMITDLESRRRPISLEIQEPSTYPPKFITELQGTTDIHEGHPAHFECRIEPLHDANLRVEFFHNGKPLPLASRFHVTSDFGYVALDISHVIPEDEGQYSVRATNALGQCISFIECKVLEKENIISESKRPKGLEKIYELESRSPVNRTEVFEAPTKQRPVFTQPLQNIDDIVEGQIAHFECKLIPVGDMSLKVEWFKDETPLELSSRITTTHNFGLASLNFDHVREEDEGIYMCRASNHMGEAVTTASMKILPKEKIVSDTKYPEIQSKLSQLETKTIIPPEEVQEVFDKPIFTQLLTGPRDVVEGQTAHYECRVMPVGDSNLRLEWFVNGVELQIGSRFHASNNFGLVSLDILKVIPEDSGIYTCKAINTAGEALSSISLKVKTRPGIAVDSIHEEAWQKIQLKEAEMNKVSDIFIDAIPQQSPIFTTPLKSYDDLIEGQNVRLEAQIEPHTDANLRIEWFKNGVSYQTGTRSRSTFEFGLATLFITGLRSDDSALYTCKATNLLGEAISTCSIKVSDSDWLICDTLHPNAITKIHSLEHSPKSLEEQFKPTYEEPIFIRHLNNIECNEGDNVNFECKIEPSKDPSLKIEWFLNGQPLPFGDRYKARYDFGHVILTLKNVCDRDSGIITVKAINSQGSAQTSGTLKCSNKQSIFLETQHPQGQAGLSKVKELDDSCSLKSRNEPIGPTKEYGKPIWAVPFQSEIELEANAPLHLEGEIEPKEDCSLKIEWYFNGKLLQHGSRYRMTYEFGFVKLDLFDTFERDSGIYTCKVSNKFGEAFTSSTVYCSKQENIIDKPQNYHLKTVKHTHKSVEDKQPILVEKAPSFTSKSDDLLNLAEGELVHFAASLIPIEDQTMMIEWFFNGSLIAASHRICTAYAFGIVILEILGAKTEDSGTYTCRATNKSGTAEVELKLICVQKSDGHKPEFTTDLQSLENLKDGQSAHFECHLTPVGDANMVVEWFHNGQPLRHSSRYKLISDFGIVIMDIAGVIPYDSGEYMCKAINKYGEAFTKATLTCIDRSGVYLQTLKPNSLAKIKELEAYIEKPKEPEKENDSPKFITHIQDMKNLTEGQSAHFEARFTPATDSDLKTEWYFNGERIPSSCRYRTFHDFGIAVLDILCCYQENSGEYECRATNKYGQDITKAVLICTSKLEFSSDDKNNVEENSMKKIGITETKDENSISIKKIAPVFTLPLSNIDGLQEGESAHFETRLTPVNDPHLKVEWFWNGKPLRTGTRFRTINDFGYVILEISPIYPEDSGEYSCRATNEFGEAVTSCLMKCIGKSSLVFDSQLPKGRESTIGKLVELDSSRQSLTNDNFGNPPEFIKAPQDLIVSENSLAHFKCQLLPVNDSSIRVEWFHNGKPLLAGTRVKTIHDFGFVILEIADCCQRDSGLYMCKAVNKHGEATITCKLQIQANASSEDVADYGSQYACATRKVQSSKSEQNSVFLSELKYEASSHPPRFITHIKSVSVDEDESVKFICRAEPKDDPSLRIEWYRNGKLIPVGHKYKMNYDMGIISMDILYVYPEDSGEYTCKVINQYGMDTTSAFVTCKKSPSIILYNQVPKGLNKFEAMLQMEATIKKYTSEVYLTEDDFFDIENKQPPRFVTHIQDQPDLVEMDCTKFDCQLAPVGDPDMKIEWFLNGQPLQHKNRFTPIYDFGYVAMNFGWVYPEDSGVYLCRATNLYGTDETSAVLEIAGKPGIIYETQLPKGMKSIEKIREMEASWRVIPEEVAELETVESCPIFVSHPETVTVFEGDWSKFCCRITGHPRPLVLWLINERVIASGSYYKLTYDGMYRLDIPKTRSCDNGKIEVIAKNSLGEARAEAYLIVKPRTINYRTVLKSSQKSKRDSDISQQLIDQEKSYLNQNFYENSQIHGTTRGQSHYAEQIEKHKKNRMNGRTVSILQKKQIQIEYKSEEKIETDILPTEQIEVKHEIDSQKCVEHEDTNVCKPPVFVKRLQSCRVYEQQEAKFEIQFEGNPLPTIKWYREDYLLTNSTDLQIYTFNTKSVLTIPQTFIEDSGVFSVIAENEAGKAKCSANLIVEKNRNQLTLEENISPSFTEVIRNTTVIHGELARFDAKVKGTKPIQVFWFKNDRKIYPDIRLKMLEEDDVHTLLILESIKEDAGTYKCIAINSAGEAQCEAKCFVRNIESPIRVVDPSSISNGSAPIILQPLTNQIIEEGTSVAFCCRIKGTPTPTIQWKKGKQLIKPSKYFQMQKEGEFYTLKITEAFPEDEGTYTCIARNTAGEIESSATLKVLVAEIVKILPLLTPIEDQIVFEGQSAKFVTQILPPDLEAEIQWCREDVVIPDSSDFQITREGNTIMLQISKTYQEDSGVFTCKAETSHGVLETSAKLIVKKASEGSTSSSSQNRQTESSNCDENTRSETEKHLGGSRSRCDSWSCRYKQDKKYHTYPKSRIPISRRFRNKYQEVKSAMTPEMYPLEPREIDLEYYQQLHTADSQEELQEFLLLESQCSGDLNLGGSMSLPRISKRRESEERGAVSDY